MNYSIPFQALRLFAELTTLFLVTVPFAQAGIWDCYDEKTRDVLELHSSMRIEMSRFSTSVSNIGAPTTEIWFSGTSLRIDRVRSQAMTADERGQELEFGFDVKGSGMSGTVQFTTRTGKRLEGSARFKTDGSKVIQLDRLVCDRREE